MNFVNRITKMIVCCCLFFAAINVSYSSEETKLASSSTFEPVLAQLISASLTERSEVIEKLSNIDDPRVLPVFENMLASKLYIIKESAQLGFISDADEGYRVTSIINDKTIGVFEKGKLKKIRVNNKLRRELRNYIAHLRVKNPNDSIRKAAVKELLKNVDENTVTILKELKTKEKNKSISELITVGLSVWNLNSDDNNIQIESIQTLSTSLLPEVKVKLKEIVSETQDQVVKKAALNSLEKIESKISMFGFLENMVFGLSLGSVLLLIAVGLAITFGVMGVINMAHGELMMLGAYTTYVVQQMLPHYIGTSVFISIPLAFIVSGLFGIAIERFVIRHLYGRPLETLLATFGISLILQQLVRSIFGPTNQAVETPAFMSGSLEINSVFAITYNRLYIFIFAIVVLLLLMLILKKTRLGLQVRAVSQNRTMAKSMGVKSEWVDAMTFGLGSGIAGIAGVALSQLTNVGPNLGQGYIIDSFMVVVFGGVGNLLGTFVGAMSLGVFNKFLEPWTGAVLAKILVLIFIILFIQKRPRGLFPKKGRGVED